MNTRINSKIEIKLTNVLKNLKERFIKNFKNFKEKFITNNNETNITSMVRKLQEPPVNKDWSVENNHKTNPEQNKQYNNAGTRNETKQTKRQRIRNHRTQKTNKTSTTSTHLKRNNAISHPPWKKAHIFTNKTRNVFKNTYRKCNAYTNTIKSKLENIKLNYNSFLVATIHDKILTLIQKLLLNLDNLNKMTDKKSKDLVKEITAIRLADSLNKAEAINIQQKYDIVSKEYLANEESKPTDKTKTKPEKTQTQNTFRPPSTNAINTTTTKPRQYTRRSSESLVETQKSKDRIAAQQLTAPTIEPSNSTKRRAKSGLTGDKQDKKGKLDTQDEPISETKQNKNSNKSKKTTTLSSSQPQLNIEPEKETLTNVTHTNSHPAETNWNPNAFDPNTLQLWRMHFLAWTSQNKMLLQNVNAITNADQLKTPPSLQTNTTAQNTQIEETSTTESHIEAPSQSTTVANKSQTKMIAPPVHIDIPNETPAKERPIESLNEEDRPEWNNDDVLNSTKVVDNNSISASNTDLESTINTTINSSKLETSKNLNSSRRHRLIKKRGALNKTLNQEASNNTLETPIFHQSTILL